MHRRRQNVVNRQNMPPTANSPIQPLGQFERIHQGRAIGWALLPDRLQHRLGIEILQGDSIVAAGQASLLHPGLTASNIGDGQYGFAIILPNDVDQTLPLHARVFGSGCRLNGEHFFTADASILATDSCGVIDGVIAGVAFGWVLQHDSEIAPKVQALVGDVVKAEAWLTARRPDVEAHHPGKAAHAFRIDLRPLLKARGPRNKPIILVHADTKHPLKGSPLNFAEQTVWGNCKKLEGRELHGWAALAEPESCGPVTLQLWLDDACIDELPADQPLPEFARFGIRFARCGFRFYLPARFLDGQPHTLRIQPKTSGIVARISNAQQTFTRTLCHRISSADNSTVTGYSFIKESSQTPLLLEAYEHGRKVGEAIADSPCPDLPETAATCSAPMPVGFSMTVAPALEPDSPRRIRLHLSGDITPIAQTEILIESCSALIRQAQAAAQQNETFRWWACELVEQLRRSVTADDSLFKEVPITTLPTEDRPVDIIVPVYKGREQTLACLDSLLKSPDLTRHQIIVINDASPDAGLTADLRTLAQREPRLALLENSTNLGFVATVNHGMALHPDRDVVLLNADTLVPASNWLERLRSAASSHPRVGTATPFSNRATICSLPLPNVDNEMPPRHTVDSLDALCAQANPGQTVELPTAVGFCMYIKRALLNEVGLFNVERWGNGYGEENDFCLQAATLGWRHVAACDLFVQHHGAVSFQGEKFERIRKNLVVLNSIYPDYPATIQRFQRLDPLAAPRNRVLMKIHIASNGRQKKIKPQTLHITHAWGGGTQHHVDQLCSQEGYILRPTGNDQAELLHPATGFAMQLPMADLAATSPGQTDTSLLETLRTLQIHAMHIHHWVGLPPAIWDLPQALGVPFDFTVHDFYSFCPRISMLDQTGQFCGQAPVSRCRLCLQDDSLEEEVEAAFRLLGNTPTAWRDFHAKQLVRARQVIAPCQDAATRISRALPLMNVVVKPHEPPLKTRPLFRPLPKPGKELRIAVIGAIGPEKGYSRLLALAQLAEVEAPHLQFFIVGHTMDDTPFASLSTTRISGRYNQEELQPLLKELDCHLALFLSPWPETYSYTLSEALSAGLTPVAPCLGALGERIRAFGGGRLFSANATSAEILGVLQE